MAKCTRCGKSGLFLRLSNGLCDDCSATVALEQERAAIQLEVSLLEAQLADKKALYEKIEADATASGIKKALAEQANLEKQLELLRRQRAEEEALHSVAKTEQAKAEKAALTAEKKVQKGKELIRAINNACHAFDEDDRFAHMDNILASIDEYLGPTVTLTLQCMDMRDLRKRYKENEKNIRDTFEKYHGRYTTKANITIYRLMVIALAAELQNVMHNLSYGKLEDALGDIKAVTEKYYAIATDGNKQIAPTMKKFIGELDYFFQEAVRIEYEYYVQKERTREEQRAIREQMRREAEERKELERQQKQIEKEESKFHEQIGQLTEQLQTSADDELTRKLQERIEELLRQLDNVAEQKEKIANLQNGKAGNVYVISNIGSFGDDVFKIGMTRRLDPEERVKELGDASVPFPFDIHSMIFSDDAAALETHLHHVLNDRRVNKVNLRKEFFRISLDELEQLVAETSPTAAFKRTILAEQYRQSLSIGHVVDIPQETYDEDTDDIE